MIFGQTVLAELEVNGDRMSNGNKYYTGRLTYVPLYKTDR